MTHKKNPAQTDDRIVVTKLWCVDCGTTFVTRTKQAPTGGALKNRRCWHCSRAEHRASNNRVARTRKKEATREADVSKGDVVGHLALGTMPVEKVVRAFAQWSRGEVDFG